MAGLLQGKLPKRETLGRDKKPASQFDCEGEQRVVIMWYWYVFGAVALIIGFISYSFLVIARRADDRKDAIEGEETLPEQVQSCDSASDMDPSLKDNSEEKVSLVALPLPPKASLTIVKRLPR